MNRIKYIVSAGLLLLSCLLIRQEMATAQISSATPWIWMHGDNFGQAVSNYGILRVPAAANKPGSRTMPVSWSVADDGNLWLFGGYGNTNSGSGRLNDLWKFDLDINQWIWVHGDSTTNQRGIYGSKGTASPANKPGARSGSARWTDTAGNLWIMGGFGFGASNAANELLNDLWKYDTAANSWTWISGDSATITPNGVYGQRGVAAASNQPGGRHGAVSWTDTEGNFWLFGGTGYAAIGLRGYLNDLWKYNVASGQWAWISGDTLIDQVSVYGVQGTPASGNQPGGRVFSSGWIDTAGQLWLLGGESFNGLNNDLWRFDPQTQMWTWIKGDNQPGQNGIYGTLDIANVANKPGARYSAASWRDDYNNFYLLGGIGFGSSGAQDFINDFWKYTPATNSWTWIKGDSLPGAPGVYGTLQQESPTNMPGGRNMTAYWTDNEGHFWIMGGDGYADGGRPTTMNDLWKLNNCITPQAPISIDGDTGVCAGASVTYSVSPVEWATGYTWTLPPGWTGNVTGNTISVTVGDQGGNISVTANTTCDSSDQISIAVTVNDPVAVINIEGFVLGTTEEFETYQWLRDEQPIPGATQANYTVAQNGAYKVAVTDELGCKDTSDAYIVNNSQIRDTHILSDQVSIYPNPAGKALFVDAPVPVLITISSLDGRTLRTSEHKQLSVEDLSAGIYLITIADVSGNRIKTEKLVKQ